MIGIVIVGFCSRFYISVTILISKLLGFFEENFKSEFENRFLYTPVFIAVGICIYFHYQFNLQFKELLGILITEVVILILLWFIEKKSASQFTHFIFFTLSIIFLITSGYTASFVREHSLQTSMLMRKVENVTIYGYVERLDLKANVARLYLTNVKLCGRDKFSMDDFSEHKFPNKIRVTLRSTVEGMNIGEKVKLTATLMPPPKAVLPGDFDFSRFAYFNEIGAIGYAISKPVVVDDNDRDSKKFRNFEIWLNNLRQKIGRRINETVSYPANVIANGILIGDAAGIPDSDFDALRTAGTAHLIAISGMHIAVATSIMFVLINIVLSFFPSLVLRYNIRVFAALGAIAGSFAYLVITAFPVSAQRAFIMSSLVLIAIVIKRYSDAFRAIAICGIILLLLTPENLFSPSLQMSFVASLALIAGFQTSYYKLIKLLSWNGDDHQNQDQNQDLYRNVKHYLRNILSKMKRVGLVISRYTFSVLYASILASLATTPYIIYHFNQFSVYSILANILCVPISDFIIMPLGMFALILMPLHLDWLLLKIVEYSIGIMLKISHYVASLPHALIHLPSLSDFGLIIVSFGIFLLCISKTSLRYFALFIIVAGISTISSAVTPDIIVSGNAKLFAVNINNIKTPDNTKILENSEKNNKKLVLSSLSNERYVRKIWVQKYKNFFDYENNLNDYNIINCNNEICKLQKDQSVVLIFNPNLNNGNLSQNLIKNWCPEYNMEVFINMYDDHKCRNAKNNITHSDLIKKGTHQIIFMDNDDIKIIN